MLIQLTKSVLSVWQTNESKTIETAKTASHNVYVSWGTQLDGSTAAIWSQRKIIAENGCALLHHEDLAETEDSF